MDGGGHDTCADCNRLADSTLLAISAVLSVFNRCTQSDVHDTYCIASDWLLPPLLFGADMYLTDHQGKSAANDERKFWERKMNKVLGGEEGCDREDIPSHLTPDADRGVVYSDELIEMKGKLTLHMAQDPPHIMYANDTFVHNTGENASSCN